MPHCAENPVKSCQPIFEH